MFYHCVALSAFVLYRTSSVSLGVVVVVEGGVLVVEVVVVVVFVWCALLQNIFRRGPFSFLGLKL
jgi:hypothetical protein